MLAAILEECLGTGYPHQLAQQIRMLRFRFGLLALVAPRYWHHADLEQVFHLSNLYEFSELLFIIYDCVPTIVPSVSDVGSPFLMRRRPVVSIQRQ